MTIFDDMWDAGGDVIDAFGDAATDLGRGVYKVAKDGTDFFVSGGKVIIDTFDDIQTAFSNLIRGAIGIRPLRSNEIATVDKLFLGAVPYHKVLIVSIEGIGGKPFTVPTDMFRNIMHLLPGSTVLFDFILATARLNGKYLIFMGDEGYRDANNYYRDKGMYDPATGKGKLSGQYLCHELTHVWQGEYQDKYAYQYVADSVGHRITDVFTGDDEYDYTVGSNWNSYTVEAQANMVDDYWRTTSGLQNSNTTSDLKWPYIRDVIRPRNPGAVYQRPRVIAKPTVAHKLTKAEADALAAQANQFRIQGEAMLRTGNPILIAQGQGYINTAMQIEAALAAAGFPVRRIGMATMTPSGILPSSPGSATSRTKIAGGGVMPPPILKK